MSSGKLGDKIYDLRMSNKLSQDELADKIKVSRQTISKWEANVYQPKTNMLMRLCEAFNVDSNYFIPKNDTTAETTDEVENLESEVVCDEVASDETNEVSLDKVEEVEIQQVPERKKRKLSKKAKIIIASVVLLTVMLVGFVMIIFDKTTEPTLSEKDFDNGLLSVTWNMAIENIGWAIFGITISVVAILGVVLICKRFKDQNKKEEVTESHIN